MADYYSSLSDIDLVIALRRASGWLRQHILAELKARGVKGA